VTATLVIIGGVVTLVLAVTGIGYLLPRNHTATREREFPVPLDRLFATVAATPDYPLWRRGVTRVDQLPARDGKPGFREVSGNGTITFVIDDIVQNRRIVSRIADPALPFGGTWTYEFSGTGSRSVLRITEDGEVYNPVFRFMSRYVFGHDRTMNQFLDDLDQRLSPRSGGAATR
jgi:hypothetical protein